jgi:hypothetical protein
MILYIAQQLDSKIFKCNNKNNRRTTYTVATNNNNNNMKLMNKII